MTHWRHWIALTATLWCGVPVPAQPAADRPISLELRPRFRVGGPGEERLSLSHVYNGDVVATRQGVMYVLDREENRVVAFDGEGRELRVLGRRGRGPGELGNVIAIAAAPDGGLLVVDHAKRALVRFDASGGVLPERSLAGLGLVQRVFIQGRDTLVYTTRRDSSLVLKLDGGNGAIVDGATNPASKPAPSFSRCGLRHEQAPFFAHELRVAGSHELIALNRTAAFTVDVRRANGTRSTFARTRAAERATPAVVRRQYGDSVRLFVNDRPCAVPTDVVLREVGVAATVPPYDRLVIDNTGRVWALRRADTGSHLAADLFSPSAGYIGTVTLGKASPVAFLPDGALVSLEEDEDETPEIVVYAVRMGVR